MEQISTNVKQANLGDFNDLQRALQLYKPHLADFRRSQRADISTALRQNVRGIDFVDMN